MHSRCVANHIVLPEKFIGYQLCHHMFVRLIVNPPRDTGISKWISQTGHTRIIDVSLRAALVDFSCAIDVAGVSLCGWRSQFGYSC